MSTLAPDLHTLRQPLYHAITIPAAGGAAVNTAFANATAAARGYLTNMEQDGRLPSPDSFELHSPRIFPAAVALHTDQNLVVSAFTQIWANGRTFFEGPAWLMPAGAGLAVATGAAVTWASHGMPSPEHVLRLAERALGIEAGQSFRQVLDHTSSTLPANAVVTHFVWDGLYTRAAQ